MPRPSFEEIQDFYRNGHKSPLRGQLRSAIASILCRLPAYPIFHSKLIKNMLLGYVNKKRIRRRIDVMGVVVKLMPEA